MAYTLSHWWRLELCHFSIVKNWNQSLSQHILLAYLLFTFAELPKFFEPPILLTVELWKHELFPLALHSIEHLNWVKRNPLQTSSAASLSIFISFVGFSTSFHCYIISFLNCTSVHIYSLHFWNAASIRCMRFFPKHSCWTMCQSKKLFKWSC